MYTTMKIYSSVSKEVDSENCMSLILQPGSKLVHDPGALTCSRVGPAEAGKKHRRHHSVLDNKFDTTEISQ